MTDFDSPERDVMHKPLHSIPLPLAMRQGPGCTRDHREARVPFIAWMVVALMAGIVFAAAIGG